QRRDAPAVGHEQVEQQDVRHVLPDEGDTGNRIHRLPHDLVPLLRLEQAAKSFAENRVVVSDDDANGVVHVRGMLMSREVPRPGGESSTSPPRRPRTRSLITTGPLRMRSSSSSVYRPAGSVPRP